MNITLKPIDRSDTENILKWRNSEEVKKNFIYRKDLTEEEHNNWLETKVKTHLVYQFIITADSKKIGSVYLQHIDKKNMKAEFGIFIGETLSQGKGYGKTATELLLKFAFEELKLNKVYLRVLAENERAIRCYEKSGFITEGCFRQDEIIDAKPYDIVFMGILKSEWTERNE